jgi:hypothetical protein
MGNLSHPEYSRFRRLHLKQCGFLCASLEKSAAELADIRAEELDKLTGKYLYAEQVEGIGDYPVEITRDGQKLIILDLITGERDEMRALDESRAANSTDTPLSSFPTPL